MTLKHRDTHTGAAATRTRHKDHAAHGLQASMMTLMCGEPEEHILRRMLLATCGNDKPSGGGMRKISLLNLYSVEYALRKLGLCVLVVGATCMDRSQSGWLLRRWSLGQKRGRLVGGICWLTDDAHAAPWTDDFFAAVELYCTCCMYNAYPPVGAV